MWQRVTPEIFHNFLYFCHDFRSIHSIFKIEHLILVCSKSAMFMILRCFLSEYSSTKMNCSRDLLTIDKNSSILVKYINYFNIISIIIRFFLSLGFWGLSGFGESIWSQSHPLIIIYNSTEHILPPVIILKGSRDGLVVSPTIIL
jgi:hypothetical protein